MRGVRPGTAMATGLLLLCASAATAQDASPLPSTTAAVVEPVPNAERALTHDELLAVRGELGAKDVYTTMVAEATIERLPRPRQIVLGRRAKGGFGTLPRGGAYPGDPVVEAKAAVRDRYPPRRGPSVGGLLAFTVTDALELHGEVSTPAGTYLTPVTPEAMALADALPVDALVLARGSLTELTPETPCPRLPDELRGTGYGGSPFAACPTGWLTAEPVSEVRADDPLTPVAFGIRVQARARAAFSDVYDRPYEEPATYLLRHEANPLDGGSPELGWKVIGRVDAVEPPAAPALLASAQRPGGLGWQPVLERVPPSDTAGYASFSGGGPVLSTAWEGGFASVHQGRDRVLSAWVSPDGRTWRSADLPRGIRHVDALLRLGDGLAIVADTTVSDWDVRDWGFDVWRSADGLAWRQVGRHVVETPARFAERGTEYYRIVQGYWSLGDRIVAHETYTTYRCCGRSDSTVFVAAAATEEPVTFAWTSRDGETWARRPVRGLSAADGWHYRDRVQQGDGDLVAFSEGPTFAIDRSTDGVRWRTIGRQPRGLDHYAPVAFAETAAGYVVGGTVAEPQGEGAVWGSAGVLWFSPDGERWTEAQRPATGFPVDLASVGDTVVAMGAPSSGTGDPGDEARPWLLASLDGGQTWDERLAWAADEDWCLSSLTSGGEATIVLDVACPPLDVASKYAVTVEPSAEPGPSSDSPAAVVTALEAVECDDPRAMTGSRYAPGGEVAFGTPELALQAALADFTLVPREGYHVLEATDDAVLFGYRNRDEVKTAVRVRAVTEAGSEVADGVTAWAPDGIATCHVSELGDAPMGPDVRLWTNRAGRAIHETSGSPECSPALRFLYVTDSDGPEGARRTWTFVRDPEGDLRGRWRSTYRRATTLPPRAYFTGYRRDGAELWMAADRSAVFQKRGSSAEQWPRVANGAACT